VFCNADICSEWPATSSGRKKQPAKSPLASPQARKKSRREEDAKRREQQICTWKGEEDGTEEANKIKLAHLPHYQPGAVRPYGWPVNWSLLDVRLAVLYHKWNAKGGLLGNPEAVAALEFAEEGYTGSAPGAYKTGPSCDSSGVKTWPNQPMPWSWSGVHTYQAPR
jgi:hypothetical protein